MPNRISLALNPGYALSLFEFLSQWGIYRYFRELDR
jgi:hypothetical protein